MEKEAVNCLSHHLQIFIHRRSAQPALPCQFTHIHLPSHKCGIVPVECWRDIVLGGLGSADGVTFGFGVRHAGFHPCTQDGQFQFRKNPTHLNERLAHGVNFAAAAINGDGTYNDEPQALLIDDADDLAQLLGAAA